MDMCLLSVGASTPKLLLIVHGPNKPLKRVSKKSVVIRWAVNKKWVSYIDIFLGLITPLSWEQLRRPSAKIWMWNLTGMGCVPNPIFLPLLGIKYLECMSVFRQGFVQILHGAIVQSKTVQRSGDGHFTHWTNEVLVTSQGGAMGQQTVKVCLDLQQTVWFCRRVTRLNWVKPKCCSEVIWSAVLMMKYLLLFTTWTKQWLAKNSFINGKC